ncbi:MAG: ethanolamine utilization protein EutP [Clostridia bacterium]|nr:ethanolamine utilization protein EutP [Clostridia bacterium]
MRRLILIGRVGAGKTTLTQALKGQQLEYCKTQFIHYTDTIIDTPGEYIQTRGLGAALALYTYESDVVGLLVSAAEPFTLFPPCITNMCNREVIGILTGIDRADANIPMTSNWLRLAGCKKIFPVSSITGEGLNEIIAFLDQDAPEGRPSVRRPVHRH